MLKRTITGFCLVLTLVAAVMAGPYSFLFLFSAICLFSLIEFYRIINKSSKPNSLIGVLIGMGFFVISSINLSGAYQFNSWLLPTLFAICLFLAELFRQSKRPFDNIGSTLLGVAYVVFPFFFFIKLGFLGPNHSYSSHAPLAFLIMLWSNDTGAYLVGKYFGQRKLFERHSPKKTWEGAAGGLFLALISGFVIATYFTEWPLSKWLISAPIIVCFATLGDLVESMLKRSYSIKDSGHILPGHGGLLDRFDGLLLAAPAWYLFVSFLNP